MGAENEATYACVRKMRPAIFSRVDIRPIVVERRDSNGFLIDV
jgi:hypothetical protein